MRRPPFYIVLAVLIVSAITGPIIERNHYKDLKKREQDTVKSPIVNFGVDKLRGVPKIKKAELVTGEIVIGADYFRSFIAKVNNILGWNIPGFERVLDRGRREAIQRMRENAHGANCIVNTRIEMIRLNKNGRSNIGTSQCSIVAYGTAITYDMSSFQKGGSRRFR